MRKIIITISLLFYTYLPIVCMDSQPHPFTILFSQSKDGLIKYFAFFKDKNSIEATRNSEGQYSCYEIIKIGDNFEYHPARDDAPEIIFKQLKFLYSNQRKNIHD